MSAGEQILPPTAENVEIDYPVVSAENGLQVIDKKVKLGGELVQDTVIESTEHKAIYFGNIDKELDDFNVRTLQQIVLLCIAGARNGGISLNEAEFWLFHDLIVLGSENGGYTTETRIQGETLKVKTKNLFLREISRVLANVGINGNLVYDSNWEALAYSKNGEWKRIANVDDISASNGLSKDVTTGAIELGGDVGKNTNIFGQVLGVKYDIKLLDFNLIELRSQFVDIKTGDTGVTSVIGYQFIVTSNAGYDVLTQQDDTLFIKTEKFILKQTNAATNINNAGYGNFQYDTTTNRLIYSNGTSQWKYVANLQDITTTTRKYPLTFSFKNYVSANSTFSFPGDYSLLNAYFIEKNTYLRGVKVVIGTADTGTNITFSVKRRNTQTDGFATDFDITTGTEIWAATKTITGTGTRKKITQDFAIVGDILIPEGSLIQVGTTTITGAFNTLDTTITLQLQEV